MSGATLSPASAEVGTTRASLHALQPLNNSAPATSAHCAHPPIQRLSDDVLVIIFGHVVAPKGAAASLVLSQVCRAWRALLLHTPSLWRVTGRILLWGDDRARNEAFSLLLLCDQRSGSSLTSATIQFNADFNIDDAGKASQIMTFSKALEVLGRSGSTLVSLDVWEDPVSSSAWPCGHVSRRPGSAPLHAAQTTATMRLLELVSGAEKIDDLNLFVTLPHGMSLAPFEAVEAIKSRPRRLCLQGPRIHCNCAETFALTASFRRFLDTVAAEVLHLRYDTGVFCDEKDWAWQQLRQHADSLQSCHMYLEADKLPSLPELTLPSLQEATFYTCGPGRYGKYTEEDWLTAMQRPTWFHTPTLRRICTYPDVATRVQAPLITEACLLLDHEEDLQALDAALASWPQLSTLTIAVACRGSEWWGAALLQRAVQHLTPGHCGSINVPKLRHLGLLHYRIHDAAASDTPEVSWPHRMSFTAAEKSSWTPYAKGRKPVNICDPPQSPDLRQLEQQRRRLHQGYEVQVQPATKGDPRKASQPVAGAVRGECCALETIKLGGLQVDAQPWRDLLQSSEARLCCFPDPLNPVTKSW